MVPIGSRRLVIQIVKILSVVAVITAGFIAWRLLVPPPVNQHTRIVVIFKSTDPTIVYWQIVKAGVK